MNEYMAEAMEGGYVRLHRSMLEWEWYGDESVTALFLHLLLSVNWRPGKFRGEDVEQGSCITSLDKLADTFGWSRGKLRRTLDKLKSTGEVVTKTTNHWTTVTLVNWAKYQNSDQPNGQQKSNRAPTVRQQPATIEEGKKERKEEEKGVGLVWPSWAGDRSKAMWAEFIAYRIREKGERYKSIQTEQRALNLACRYFPNGPHFVEALEHAMAKTWQFPVDPAEYKYPFGQSAKGKRTPEQLTAEWDKLRRRPGGAGPEDILHDRELLEHIYPGKYR